jgi:hypothetical protein
MPQSADSRPRAPLNDEIAIALAGLVNDAQAEKSREPTHSDLDFQFSKAALGAADPKVQGQMVGKAKRVRAVLTFALENAPDKGEVLVASLISLVRAKGGFRKESPNYCGDDTITDLVNAFKNEGGYALTTDGVVQPTSLDTLTGSELTAALESYVRRARRGSEDAALMVGTAKDLLEASAAHVIQERYGTYPQQANLPTLLGQAFVALDLMTPQQAPAVVDPPQHRLQRALYEAGCAVNALRNKQGTGHGRPWLATVTDVEARAAVQLIGIVSGFLLAAHKAKP